MTEYLPYLALAVFVALALVCFFSLRKAKARVRLMLTLIGIAFLLFAILPTVGTLTENESLIGLGVTLPGSIFFIGLPSSTYLRYRRCVTPISAICTDAKHVGRYGESRVPVFRYTVDGKQYESASFLVYSRRRFTRLFETGHPYTVYVDPVEPTECADKRFFPKSTQIMLLAIGIVCLLLSAVFVAQLLL